MNIVIADKLDPITHQSLTKLGFVIHADASLSDERLTQAIREYNPELLVVRSTKVRQEQIDASSSLSLIIRAGAGTNTIDVEYASKKGIYVANCPGKNAIAVAELTMGHLLNLDRRISDNVSDLRSGIWNKKEYSKAGGLFGKKLAIIGLGSCGLETLKRAKAFGMNISVWSRSFSPQKATALGVHYASSPKEAATDAHALTVHLALNTATRGIISTDVLSSLCDGAYVINTSRGGIIDEQALLSAIEKKGLRAGLDVFDQEPSSSVADFSTPTTLHTSVYGTHHIGASTGQASQAVAQEVVDIAQRYRDQGTVQNCVNLAKSSLAQVLITVRHADKVGVLARVLENLRKEEHNIQEMENILFSGGKAACAKIHLIGTPSPTLLRELQQDDDIFAVSITTKNNQG